jgi:hypothetical protein
VVQGYGRKNVQDMSMFMVENKRQIIVVAFSSFKGNILLFEVIFHGLTIRSLPPLNDGKHACLDSGWNLTFGSNHWSTIDTCKT